VFCVQSALPPDARLLDELAFSHALQRHVRRRQTEHATFARAPCLAVR
jgi:hypothetical protein